MTPPDLARMEELAKSATPGTCSGAEFATAANPQTILSLIDEIRRKDRALMDALDTLRAADDDIREHLQVARYNLTGMMHTGDQCPIPNPPVLIHAAGISASDAVRERIRKQSTEISAILSRDGGNEQGDSPRSRG